MAPDPPKTRGNASFFPLNGTNALWDLGNKPLYVGFATIGTVTGNVFTVGSGGVATNISSLAVTANNTLALGAGGRVYAGAVTNAGTLIAGLDDTATPACGRLAVTGNLNITGATLQFSVTGNPAQSAYVIASYGSLTGAFAATNGLPTGTRIDYDFGGAKQIVLVGQDRGTVFTFR